MSTAWMDAAACVKMPGLPWTADTGEASLAELEAMRYVCRSCPVVTHCTTAAGELDVTAGVWAGVDRDPDAMQPLGLLPVVVGGVVVGYQTHLIRPVPAVSPLAGHPAVQDVLPFEVAA